VGRKKTRRPARFRTLARPKNGPRIRAQKGALPLLKILRRVPFLVPIFGTIFGPNLWLVFRSNGRFVFKSAPCFCPFLGTQKTHRWPVQVLAVGPHNAWLVSFERANAQGPPIRHIKHRTTYCTSKSTRNIHGLERQITAPHSTARAKHVYVYTYIDALFNSIWVSLTQNTPKQE
jgi:hypothetical protein